MLTLDSFTACGAHQNGHFLLSSGLHSSDYLQCALYLAHPRRAEEAGRMIAEKLLATGVELDLVVSPALGGLIIGHETARALDLPSIFTERAGTEMALRRGFAVARGQRVVVVEDVVTTGKSTREVISILQAMGAEIKAMASLVNRSGQANPFAPMPFEPLLQLDFPKWAQGECPLCAEGQPITKPGSRPIR